MIIQPHLYFNHDCKANNIYIFIIVYIYIKYYMCMFVFIKFKLIHILNGINMATNLILIYIIYYY